MRYKACFAAMTISNRQLKWWCAMWWWRLFIQFIYIWKGYMCFSLRSLSSFFKHLFCLFHFHISSQVSLLSNYLPHSNVFHLCWLPHLYLITPSMYIISVFSLCHVSLSVSVSSFCFCSLVLCPCLSPFWLSWLLGWMFCSFPCCTSFCLPLTFFFKKSSFLLVFFFSWCFWFWVHLFVEQWQYVSVLSIKVPTTLFCLQDLKI